MSAPNSRKRAAPGTSPIVPIQRNMQQPYEAEPVAVANPAMPWGGIGGVPDPTDYFGAAAAVHGDNPYGLAQAPPPFPPAVSTPSTSLARRQMNRALVPTNLRAAYDASTDRWSGFGDDGLLVPQNAADSAGQDNIEVLEEMAQKAKREAQAKRKQIPPFVQKLSRQVVHYPF